VGLPPSLTPLLAPPAQPEPSAAADTRSPFPKFLSSVGSIPPLDKYLTLDDQIMVTVVTSSTTSLFLSTRILKPDGQISIQIEQINPAAGRAFELFRFPVPEGFLLTADVAPATIGAPIRGQTWIRISIARKVTPSQFVQIAIASGYLTLGGSLSYPSTLPEYTSRGPGASIEQTVGNPAAGADWSIAVPASAVWVLLTARASFVTSAAVANRIPRLQFFDGATLIMDVPTTAVITASQTCSLSWGAGGTSHNPTGTLFSIGFPPAVRLNSTFTIRSTTTAIDAADQWSNIRLYVQEWNGPGS